MRTDPKAFALDPDSIQTAFSEPPLADGIAQVYSQILERMKDTTENNRRTVLALLLVTGSTELLNRAAISGFQLGPFQISDLSLIRIVLPAVASYLFYDIMTNSIRNIYSRRLVSLVNSVYRPALYASQFARLTYPQGSSLFGPFSWYESNTRTYGAIQRITAVLRAGSVLTPLALVSYWYARLFRSFGFSNILLWISLLAATGFLVFSILILIEALRSNLIAPVVSWPLSDRITSGSRPEVARRWHESEATLQSPAEKPDEPRS